MVRVGVGQILKDLVCSIPNFSLMASHLLFWRWELSRPGTCLRTFIWHPSGSCFKSGMSRETNSADILWPRKSNKTLSWICNAGNGKERTVCNKCLSNRFKLTLSCQQETSMLEENKNDSPHSGCRSCQVPSLGIFFNVSVSRCADTLVTYSIFTSLCRQREKGRILFMCHTLRLMVVC